LVLALLLQVTFPSIHSSICNRGIFTLIISINNIQYYH
jgi:hypothetical protein